jgi:hypothetical protein
MRTTLSDNLARALSIDDKLQVVTSFKYLGFLIGFGTVLAQYAAPYEKSRTRVSLLANTPSVATIIALEYNSVILPVMSYKVRLIPLPRWVLQGIFHCTHTLLRVPANTLNRRALVDLAEHGLPRFHYPLAMSHGMLL